MLLTNDTRPPKPAETLGQYLHEMGIEHFTAPELLRMRRAAIDVPEPPRDWWPRMIPTLRAAEWVRHRMDHPIIVGNGYRPEPFNSRVGGARRSQHLYFRALDLDLPLRHRSQDNPTSRSAIGRKIIKANFMKWPLSFSSAMAHISRWGLESTAHGKGRASTSTLVINNATGPRNTQDHSSTH